MQSRARNLFVVVTVALVGSLGAPGLMAADEGDNPIPTVTAITPNAAIVGSQPLAVTIAGAGFAAGATALWDGNPRPTSVVDASSLTMTLSAEDLAVAGAHLVSVANPPPGGGTSATVAFQVSHAVPGVSFSNTAMTYLSAASTYRLIWNETDPGSVASRTVHQQYAARDLNGGCDVAWIDSWTLARASGMRISGFGANRCYRWIVTLTNADGAVSQATSGPLRILPTWTGTYNLYRSGVFSTQQTRVWCTAAGVQTMLNIIRGWTDHSKSGQQAIYTYEQANDRYPDGVPGSDPQGQAAALQAFGAGHYSIFKAGRFTTAVNAAARRMRLTGKPVGLYVSGGNHTWVLTGFAATGDPAFASSFSVTALYVLGPLYPIQINKNGYYDPPPNKRLTIAQFAKVFTLYYDRIGGAYSIWQGSFVTLNP